MPFSFFHRCDDRCRRRFRFATAKIFPNSITEKNGQHGGEHERLAHVGLHLHVIMNHTADGGDIREPVQRAPAFAAETLNHRVRRSDGQRHHDEQGSESEPNIFARDDFMQRARNAERAVEAVET